jgi:chromosome partitioning protein
MKTVALVTQKGGSGKSTIAVHLAVCAARRGKAVALVDLDPQSSVADWRAERKTEDVEVVPCRVQELPALLASAKKQGADLVILDTAGRADSSVEQVIEVADVVLIPCRPSPNDLRATPRTIEQVTRAAKRGAKAFLVLNACPVQGSRHEEARAALSPLLPVAPVALHQYVIYADAVNDGLSVEESEPKSKAAQEIAALYEWLVAV